MKILLATGIYPPDIGGPATYCRALARELHDLRHVVTVVTYCEGGPKEVEDWTVVRVAKGGGPIVRWWRYSRALRRYGKDADIVYSFSSVSCGLPLRIARLTFPKKVLRLGGDFLWERYTDRGGKLGLRAWYRHVASWLRALGAWLLTPFDYVVFSSVFQRDIYEASYGDLPDHGVIENASPVGIPIHHERHAPLRLLFLGRFVGFKQIDVLLDAVAKLKNVTLTIAGSGPLQRLLERQVATLGIGDRVGFLGNREGSEKQKLFFEHDLLVLPSLTEISPNVALEARAVGLPVLLTEHHGLSVSLMRGMIIRDLSSASAIVKAIEDTVRKYKEIAEACAKPGSMRSWQMVAQEHCALFTRLLSSR